MMLFATLTWWYTTGWSGLVRSAGRRMRRVLETFSVSLLFENLFQPFRQISAGSVQGGGLDTQLRAFGDRLFSRLFGLVVRSLFIGMGCFGALFMGLVSLVEILLWPFLPLLPCIGLGLALSGWTF